MTNGESSPEKPVEDWVTGEEPLTGPQRSYLETLAREAGEEVPDGLTKAQASQLIDRLQSRTGRGDTGQGAEGGGERGGEAPSTRTADPDAPGAALVEPGAAQAEPNEPG